MIMALTPEIKAFSDTTGVGVEGGISLPETTYITSSATDADTYEPDDTYDQAGVIILDDPAAQSHNFHSAGDQDWVKFFALSGIVYTIEASNVTQDADVVLELYDTDGTTLLGTGDDYGKGREELLEFTSQSDGVYYVRVRNYDDTDALADNLAYELKVYLPIGFSTGYITGTVYDSSNNSPISDALISADLGGSAISIVGGYYFMIVARGTYTITCSHEGYLDATVGGISVQVDTVELNIPMTSLETVTDPTPDIKANGTDNTVTIGTGDTLSITVSLDAGGSLGADGDWWVVVNTPTGEWEHYNLTSGAFTSGLLVTYQSALFNLGSTVILNKSGLGAGTFTYYFGVDMVMNGSLDMGSIYYDSVVVNVTP